MPKMKSKTSHFG